MSYSSLFGLLPSVVRGSCPTSIQSVWVNSSLDPLRTSYSSLFCLRPSAMSYSENPYSALSPLCPSRPDTICSFTLSLPFLRPSPHCPSCPDTICSFTLSLPFSCVCHSFCRQTVTCSNINRKSCRKPRPMPSASTPLCSPTKRMRTKTRRTCRNLKW